MAIRHDELLVTEAVVYRFPTHMIRTRRARARMVRRRRTAVGLATVLVAVGILVSSGTGVGARTGHAAPPTVVVGVGDTLWDLAERFAPEGTDLRAYVAAVDELNRIEGPLHPGTRLRLPR